jgi:HNH endonuclease
VGGIAGSVNEIGYRIVQIAGRKFLAHRIAVLYVTGKWPKKKVTFRNGDKSDCRWKNLIL